VSPKGQITLPIAIRRQLGIRPKDLVDIDLHDGHVHVRAAQSRITRFYGIAGSLPHRQTWDSLEAIIHEETALNAAREGLEPDA
jgi:AbrB family looped-hinge helix DNA binding protein